MCMRRSSGAATLFSFCILAFFPFCVRAADLVNINTADSAALQTLDGIGPSKAQAIIDYRTQNGPFQSIEDIQNVSGIGPATYDKIKDSITVGADASAPASSETLLQQQAADAVQSPPPASAGGSGPPPISVTLTADAVSAAGAGSLFRAQAYGSEGAPLSSATYEWNFGDGSTAQGQAVFHAYAYPGSYIAVVIVASGIASAEARKTVAAVAAQVRLIAQDDGSLTVLNDGKSELNLGWWMLERGGKKYVIPKGTIIAAGGGVRFAPSILNLPPGTAVLAYPNGQAAAWQGEDPHAAGITYLSAADRAPLAGASAARAKISAGANPAADPPAPQPAAAGAAGAASPLLLSLVGLAALTVLGAAGALYARPAPALAESEEDETDRLAEEFDIVEG